MTLGERMVRVWQGTLNETQAVRECAQMLEQARRTTPPPVELLVPKSLAWKRHIAGLADKAQSGAEVKQIARLYSVSRATVYNYRKLYG